MKRIPLKILMVWLSIVLITGHAFAVGLQLEEDTNKNQDIEVNINIDIEIDNNADTVEESVQDTNSEENVNENMNNASNEDKRIDTVGQPNESPNENTDVGEKNSEDDKSLIENLLQSRRDLFGTVLDNIDNHEVQILYTQIDRDKNQSPFFKSYYYRVDSRKYFYPGSSIKLSACVLALEKLNNLGIEGLDKYTYLKIGADYPGQTKTSGTIANYIKRILLSSDNYSFNRLYEFLGQKYYNETLWSKEYKDVKVVHRLAERASFETNRHTNPFTFYKNDKIIYQQPSAYNEENYNKKLDQEGFIKGMGINTVNFSNNNYISIENLQGILKSIIFKWETPESRRFNLTDDDYTFLQKHLTVIPRQAGYNFPDSATIYRKSGYAWGYMINNAYVIDVQNNVEFLLTAVIHDGAFDNYNNYGGVNRPFLANLGRVIYDYERNRKIK
ncbi:MAG: serine hydrolase [Clostridia bacterium]